MKKLSFVITNTNFDSIDIFEKDILEIINGKYDYELIFVAQSENQEKQKLIKKSTFIICDSSLNEQIEKGFEKIDNKASAVILCDMSSGQYKEYVAKLIESWQKGAKVVRLKQVHDKSTFFERIGHFFQKLIRSVNNLIFKMVGLKNKLFCYNSYQLFDKEVFKLIKAVPSKNTYFRNHDVLSNFETDEIVTNEKLAFKHNQMQRSKKTIIALSLFIAFIVFLLTAVIVYPVTVKDKSSISFSAFMIVLCLGLFVFSAYYYFSALLDYQLNRK